MAKAEGFVVFAANDTPESELPPQVFHFDKLQNARIEAENIVREGDYNVAVVMPCVYMITTEDNPADPTVVTATPEILKSRPERGRRVKKGESATEVVEEKKEIKSKKK